MKNFTIAFLMLFAGVSYAQNGPIDFEPGGEGANWTWTVFENGSNPPLEIIDNPDPSGANTSSKVAQFTALQNGAPFAGVESMHGADLGSFEWDGTNTTVTIMVWKSVISDVGIKFDSPTGWAQPEIKVSNTVVNQWEELTFDFSNAQNPPIGQGTLGRIIIFPDFNNRSQDNVIYFDNIVFSEGGGGPPVATEPMEPAPTPTRDPATVISLFSDAYTDVPVDTWLTPWSAGGLQDIEIQGNPTKRYFNLTFIGIETIANQLDITDMTHVHLDVWSPNFTFFGLKLVDFGPGGGFGGGDDTEALVGFNSLAQGEWISLDISLDQFTGLMNRQNIAQYLFEGQPAGNTTIFVDNFYFYQEQPSNPCDDAIPLACFQPYNGSTSGATVQIAPNCGTSVTAPGVWHSYVGTGRNTEINTCGSGFDTKLTVVTANCETGAIECVGANDDACGLQSSVTFPAAFGQTYYILVHGFGSASGNYVLNAVCGIPTTVLGCTDPNANNYNPLANQDDGSCEYDVDGPCLSTRVWPSAAFTPDCTGSAEDITSIAWADEYSRVNVIAGTEYTFSSSVATDYITISDNSNNQVYLFGTGPQTWTASFTGVVRFHTHLDADCTRQDVSRTRRVACGTTVVAPNADCGSAEPIACGDLIFGSTADGLIANLPNCGTSITSKGVWYSFPGTGNPVTVSTCGSSFDTKLSVFVGTCGGEFVCVGGNDDLCGLQSEVELRFTQLGATYYVLVHGFGSATGDFELSLECVVPGCTDPIAFNYNPNATVDDGSCAYPPNPVLGCTDPAADNYDPSATQNDGSCVYPATACLDADNGQWPVATFTPSCPGGPQSITTCGFGSEYSKVNVVAGNTYGFASSVGTDHISISDENGNTAYAAGTSPVVWTATFTGVVRFYTHLDDTCPITDGGCRTKLVGCMVAPLQAPNTQTAAPAQADRLRVFPNPATTELNVDLSAFIGAPATIFIHNSLGQTLQMRQIDEVQTTLERFDLNQLQAGMYFINVQVEGRGQFTERVIVNGNR